MKKLSFPLLAIASMLLAGCASTPISQRAAFTDMTPTPTANVWREWFSIDTGKDPDPFHRVVPQVKFEGRKVYISGYRTMYSGSKEFSIMLPPALQTGALEVFWVNPDGSKVPVPLTAAAN